MAWRSKKILSLIPPSDSEESDIESDDDLEANLERREFFHIGNSNSSSPRTISPLLYDLLADLSGSEDKNDQERTDLEHYITEEQLLETTQDESSPLPTKSPAPVSYYVPETPSPIVSVTSSSSFSRPTLMSNTATRRTRKTTLIETSPMLLPAATNPVVKKRKMKQLDFVFKKKEYTGTVNTSDSTSFK